MIKAQWLGGPRDGEWVVLTNRDPVFVLDGMNTDGTPFRRPLDVAELRTREGETKFVVDFYNLAAWHKAQ